MNLADEVVLRARKFGYENPQQMSHLSRLVSSVSDEEAVVALLSIFSNAQESEESFPEQKMAGLLLWYSGCKCLIDPVDVIRSLLPNWNLSVKEIPWFLCRQLGTEMVESSIDKVRSEQTGGGNDRLLDTLSFWVRNYEN